MKDIFATFNYACEKISENGYMKDAGYNSLKRMVTECKVDFESKYGSIDELDGVKYILDEVEEVMTEHPISHNLQSLQLVGSPVATYYFLLDNL